MNLKQVLTKLVECFFSYKETFAVYRNHDEYLELLQSTEDMRHGRITPYEFRN